jgi:hypothetical protein
MGQRCVNGLVLERDQVDGLRYSLSGRSSFLYGAVGVLKPANSRLNSNAICVGAYSFHIATDCPSAGVQQLMKRDVRGLVRYS